MKKKNSLILDDEFIRYCQINNIDNIDKLAKDTFNRGFTLLKYGETPLGIKGKETVIEKEIIKEVIKEVPVEKIIEVIKEVPVKGDTTTIVKEVLVNNDEELKILKEENKKLKDDLNKITQSLDSFNRAKFLKNSDLSSLYGE